MATDEHDLAQRVDRLMAEATRLQDLGRWDEADSVIAEAENIEDQHHARLQSERA